MNIKIWITDKSLIVKGLIFLDLEYFKTILYIIAKRKLQIYSILSEIIGAINPQFYSVWTIKQSRQDLPGRSNNTYVCLTAIIYDNLWLLPIFNEKSIEK